MSLGEKAILRITSDYGYGSQVRAVSAGRSSFPFTGTVSYSHYPTRSFFFMPMLRVLVV